MSFDFEKLLKAGEEAANLIINNNNEINTALMELEDSISKFLKLNIHFEEEKEYEKEKDDMRFGLLRAALENIPIDKKKTGFNYVYIKTKELGVRKILFLIKRSSNGYPVTVVDGKNHYNADSKTEFYEALGNVISNPQTHIMFKSFKSMLKLASLREGRTQ
ncbi:hypothetical protein [Photobacterium kishitanii]|uniref:hypothetical protein n=1 Tax=Photobacterium kishitanii TaxID=318456 RepID=UPI0007F86E93|nr:hypothetical protein [Photobacterium kishitanii]OBU28962.1 hypothetical protein AYY23_22475 [Photobacterium kishitanii]PSW47163.1 hypothetical protein C0W66_19925 [Photobacterium kishitanii]